MDNNAIAERLLETAHSLEQDHTNIYRVRAYRRAANTILGLERPVEEILSEAGPNVLRRLPGIGVSLSNKIETLVRTGDFPMVKEEDHPFLVTR